ncbi:MAG: HlyD family efflux transporter periplasmic adaptor subunit [Pseudohongiellaceae bacterium]
MAMDKAIEKKSRPLWQWAVLAAVVAGVGWFLYGVLADASIRTYRVPAEQLIVSEVSNGAFEDITPIRGTIQPFNSVFLDAVAGGTVDAVLVDEGSFVEEGQPLLRLSNNDLRLNVARNDTTITEQLNNLANISNSFETSRLSTQRQIIDVEFRITTLERQKARQESLADSSLVSKEQYEALVDELDYQKKVLDNLLARQQLEEKIQMERMEQINQQVAKLQENLALSQASFEDLLVRAPIGGLLTSLPVDIGENKNRGERLGQIDVVDRYKVVAQVDEYYVTRVAPGQAAKFMLSGQEYFASVDKVYPEIVGGTFTVDLIFDGEGPASLRRGQTLQLELTLGSPVETLLLPLGGFIQDTGGNWVFVLDESGEYAVRRDIRVGRRNNRYVEVQEGLAQGDRVITSSYGQMEDMERIQLTR